MLRGAGQPSPRAHTARHVPTPRRTTAACVSSQAPTQSEQQVTYCGWCPRCRVEHCLPTDGAARAAAAQLKLLLEHHKRFDFEVPVTAAEDAFSTDYVWTKGPGRMLGVMVARRPSTGELQVLKALSGQMTERWDCPGWAGPVAAIVSTSEVYRQARASIEALSAGLHELDRQYGGAGQPQTGASGVVSELQRADRSTPAQAHRGEDSTLQTSGGASQLLADVASAAQAPPVGTGQDTQFPAGAGRAAQAPATSADNDTQVRAGADSTMQAPAAGIGHDTQATTGPLQRPQVHDRAVRKESKRARHQPRAARQHWPEWAREQHARLTEDRKALSHDLIAKVQASYSTQDLAGRPLLLLNAYHTFREHHDHCTTPSPSGFPAGTGDCCTPKLLHAALLQGLEPVSVAEFWFGSPPSTNTPQGRASAARRGAAGALAPSRVHGCLYGACAKCRTILGALLCTGT